MLRAFNVDITQSPQSPSASLPNSPVHEVLVAAAHLHVVRLQVGPRRVRRPRLHLLLSRQAAARRHVLLYCLLVGVAQCKMMVKLALILGQGAYEGAGGLQQRVRQVGRRRRQNCRDGNQCEALNFLVQGIGLQQRVRQVGRRRRRETARAG